MNKMPNPQSFGIGRTRRLVLAAAAPLLGVVLLLLLSPASRPAQAVCPDPPRSNWGPVVAADNPSVMVDEGQIANNTGTFEDRWEDGACVMLPSNVTLSASVGTITKSGTTSGTWNWQLATTAVPADETKTVTITATDREGASSKTSFSLAVKDIGSLPAKNGKIAYSSLIGNHGEIFTIDPSGGTPLQLTFNDTNDGAPSYSPDGTKVAYSGYSAGYTREIFTIDARGGTPFQVTNNSMVEGDPSYSSDGTKIAFVGWDSAADDEIYTINAAGGSRVQITNNTTGDAQPSYSPDGQKIAYAGYDYDENDWDIYTINSTGGTPVNLTNNDTRDVSPTYSPNGQKIAYECNDGTAQTEICTIDVAGGTPVRITDDPRFINPTIKPSFSPNPSYSPDGEKIAYECIAGNEREICTIDATGGIPSNVTNNTYPYNEDPSWGTVPPPDFHAPKVTSTSPTAGATGVAPSANITATFSESMLPSTINTTTFTLFKGTTPIAAAVRYDSTTKKATLDPYANLLRGATYKAVVSTGAKDVAGNALDQLPTTPGSQSKQWVFTVRRF